LRAALVRLGVVETSERLALRGFAAVVIVFQIYVVVGGLISLIGWVADIPRLTDWDNDGICIQPNTTVAATLAGTAMLLLISGRCRPASVLGVAVALIGSTALFQHISGIDLGIDRWLMFDRTWGREGVLSPGRMGPAGATSWTLIGTAIALASLPRLSRAQRFVPVVALVTAGISGLALIGYLYGSRMLYSLPNSTVIAFQTASFILAVSLGLLVSVPQYGMMSLLSDSRPGGVLARRILPAILLVPVLIGFVPLMGERTGLYDTAFGSAIRTLIEILLFTALMWWTGAVINRQAREREEADRESQARQAADLMERERSNEIIAALNAQLSADLIATMRMHEVSVRLVRAEDVSTLLQEIVDAAVAITDASKGNIQLLEADGLRIAAHHGFGPPFLEFFSRVRGEVGACGAALMNGTRVIVEDVTTSPIFVGTPARDILLNADVRAVQSTPLISRAGRLLGMFSTHYRSPHRPSDRELRMLDLLARQAADLIERRQTDKQREELLDRERAARSEAERAARLKDEFLATLSHELRTPLNAIIGWSQILRRDIWDAEKAHTAVEIIERNGRLQAQLITELLDISRIISGNMRLDIQPVELPAVIDAAIESMTPAADAKGVRIERIFDASEPIKGDPARLQQVVWNLLSNAVKFTPQGGVVQVVLAWRESHVEIRVSDTGEGIAPEFVPHIFERFRQADASTSRSHRGLGLGLAIVKQFVELHGGNVRAASDGKGQGSTFVIELPRAVFSDEEGGREARFSAVSPAPPPPVTVPLECVRVLLVDDEPDALAMIRRVMEECAATVRTAPSAEAGLDLLKRESFDVIVSDIGMPMQDGYDFIAEVRARGIRTPALALTAFAHADDRIKAILSGYQVHISKPVDTHELLAAVGALVGRNSALRSIT
jgi:signal transduction histidine kinase/CheY-like chemotaxis protein